MQNEEKLKFKISLIYTFLINGLILSFKLYEFIFDDRLYKLGIYPRKFEFITGIITSPFIHGDFLHLFSNLFPLFTLLAGLFYFYSKECITALSLSWVLTGLSVWIFGRESFHIGASGIVYALAFFIFFSGIFRKDPRSMVLSLITIILYGGLVWGIFDLRDSISFESHFFGAFWGIVIAFFFRKNVTPIKYDWEDEENEYGGNLEVSYKKGYPFE